jgi:hypothetical protein
VAGDRARSSCIDEKTRDVVVDACAKFEGTCDSDADCTAGGCGGELCFNPAQSDRISDCKCVALPEAACGCWVRVREQASGHG